MWERVHPRLGEASAADYGGLPATVSFRPRERVKSFHLWARRSGDAQMTVQETQEAKEHDPPRWR